MLAARTGAEIETAVLPARPRPGARSPRTKPQRALSPLSLFRPARQRHGSVQRAAAARHWQRAACSAARGVARLIAVQMHLLPALFSVVSYAYFCCIFSLYWAFLVPRDLLPAFAARLVPWSLSSAPRGSSDGGALLLDVLLLASFALPHSALARAPVKAFLGLPTTMERPFYILQSSALLHLQLAAWRDFGGAHALWDMRDDAVLCGAIMACFLAGLLFLLTASFALDHFHLLGLSQGLGVDVNAALGFAGKAPAAAAGGLSIRWHYAFVAHPIMTGTLVCLWATPLMTFPRLLFAAVNSLYIFTAVKCFEEPALRAEIGEPYSRYLQVTPSFCPFAWPRAGVSEGRRGKGRGA